MKYIWYSPTKINILYLLGVGGSLFHIQINLEDMNQPAAFEVKSILRMKCVCQYNICIFKSLFHLHGTIGATTNIIS